MKPITKQINGKNQKWLLCAALLLALGTQSYYQVSSVQFDSIELASEDATMEKIELKLKLKAKEKEIEEKVLAENKEEQKPDNLKLYDFYKTHEILKKAQAQATDDESDKEKKLNHALAFATKAKAFLAKVLQDNKDKAEEIALYVSYKKYELKNKIEAKSETDKKIKADKLLKAKDYNIKAAAIAASLHEAEDASVEISASNKVTEGTASAAEPCEGGCGLPFDLSIAEFKKISERAEVPVETPKEKRERLAEEKREARLEKAEAKRQALKDKKEALNDKFTEQAEALAEECKENQEVGCATAKMTELLMDFTGDQKVDKSVVMGSRLEVSIQASRTCGFTSRSKNTSTRSTSGTLSVSRSSGSDSGLPSLSRQMAAVSSRSERAARMAFLAGAGSFMPVFVEASSSRRSNSSRSLTRSSGMACSIVRIDF